MEQNITLKDYLSCKGRHIKAFVEEHKFEIARGAVATLAIGTGAVLYSLGCKEAKENYYSLYGEDDELELAEMESPEEDEPSVEY